MRPHLLFVAVLSLLPAGAGGFISPLVRGGGKLQEKRACILHQHVVASAGIGSVSGVQRSRSATSTHLSASVSEGQDQEYQQQHKLAAVSAGDSQKIEQPGARIVLCAGFEAFNLQLYRSVADELLRVCPQLHLEVFTDRDIAERSSVVSAALESADAVFISLVFDFDQVQFLRKNIESVRIRLVFESALELMELTKIGEFTMKGGGGPPAPIKALLSKFGSGKEEDRLAGYLQLLKVGPSLLKMVPGTKAKDLQSWLELYSYWNQGGLSNVLNLFLMLGDRYLLPEGTVPPATALKETPSQGLVHPQSGGKFFETPAQFLRWYEKSRGLEDGYKYAPPGAPVVALLLYRKHVITQQRYISQLISGLEEQGILPLPIFINGVEAHTVVRDMLTSENEQRSIREGRAACPTLSTEAVSVEAIVNTIGFPLVGGPAGSMEAGRRVDVATDILSDMDVPYTVSAPLLIQNLGSWRKDGVQGLQQVVLQALPELDGAIDNVVLGGLVGDTIGLVPERVRRLGSRLLGWIQLRRTPPSQRKVAVMLYGFPPNVGAVGTAALLNVPSSLEALLKALAKEGYNLGDFPEDIDGEALVAALKVINQDSVIARGYEHLPETLEHASSLGEECSYRVANPRGLAGAVIAGAGIPAVELGKYLSRRKTRCVENAWGELERYRGIGTSSGGDLVVAGLQLGNIFIGVQPLLGVEGDPMRLLFQKDLTPHPQYCAFYEWLKQDYGAHAVIHCGMHGTYEWLPEAQTAQQTWPDLLMGYMPNLYIYAANNPSESILAKRRGYGTLVSHNVPPYARAGLYKELTTLKAVVNEYRESPESSAVLRPTIVAQAASAGLFDDLPYQGKGADEQGVLSPEEAEQLSGDVQLQEFNEYVRRLHDYLLILEQRLFSEGLHTLGKPPSPEATFQYLSAYFDGGPMPLEVLHALSELPRGTTLPGAIAVAREVGSRVSPDQPWSQVTVTEHQSLLSRELSPDKVSPTKSIEEQHEESLPFQEWLQWQLLKVGRALGIQSASDAMKEILHQLSAANGDEQVTPAYALSKHVAEAFSIKFLLDQTDEELTGVLKGLSGGYVKPGVGGDLLRDGSGVLPTGRNIHSLDPYRMPSDAAWARGREAAQKILATEVRKNGAYPETVAVTMWGLDSIKTRGESIAIALELVGARPVREATGRIVKYQLVPLEELGRPRIDVLASMSGIFRDSFANVVSFLDDLFEAAATADEPPESNYVRKHTLALEAKGVERPTSRLFSNPAGDYGSLVNERVGSGDWEESAQLGATWQSRNAFSYGREGERGTSRPECLQLLLDTTSRVVQQIDSVEYGLSDIQEYYANTGALSKAAEMASAGKEGPSSGKKVGVSIIEAFSKKVEPKELDEQLRIEYRTKMLNPKWAEAMANQGSGGAYEISQRMTALIGWSGTVGFKDKFVYDGVADVYALDEEMAAKLRKSNPEAYQNVLKRCLEAHGRGFWQPDEETLEQIRQQYADLEDQIEMGSGNFLPSSMPSSPPAKQGMASAR